ncbi:ankyrin repeat domain-containing protein [Pedobacter lithocola]|uniref:Ankyrin repeat domain-containing protein n=1 Tax=Pedobacter lithocola TaxID=1908239 RepID=A0ABV8P8G9_9SPHI
MKNKIFSLAMDGKTEAMAQELRLNNADVNKNDDLGYSALAIAVARGHKEAVKVLLDYGASANTQDAKGNTPLHYVSENNDLELARLLLNHGADLSLQNTSGNQPLWTATFSAADGDKSKLPLVKLLLERGADREHLNSVGKKPLDIAQKIGVQDLIDICPDYITTW